MIWIISISTQINAGFTPCPPRAPRESCKIYEVGRRSIQFRVCGGVLRSYFGYACGYRKRRKRNAISEADEIVLKEQRANRFLSTHHVTKRSFNVVEECCVEGCVWEEIFEYCKPTQFWITWKKKYRISHRGNGFTWNSPRYHYLHGIILCSHSHIQSLEQSFTT